MIGIKAFTYMRVVKPHLAKKFVKTSMRLKEQVALDYPKEEN